MKIAVIIDIWHPIIGGSQTHVWELSSQLIEKYGCSIDIFTWALKDDGGEIFKDDETFFDGKLRVFRVGPATVLSSFWGRALTLITVPIKLTQENKRNRYDLIHAHSILGGWMGFFAKYLIKRPLVFTVHGAPNMGAGRKTLDYFIEKLILTKTKYNRVISVGKGYLRYPNVNKNIEVIPNGVDLDRFREQSDTPKADFFKILFVGRLDWIKGIDDLIHAMRILKESNPSLLERRKVQLHLVGYGFDRAKYEKMVVECQLDKLIYFRGKMTGAALVREYKTSHLFILPSICEGQPVTILEAMASRLPVLTTYAADNSNIIDPTIGWKVMEKDSQAVADKIVEIIQLTPKRLETMGERGHRKVSKNYTWDKIAEKTFNIYNELK